MTKVLLSVLALSATIPAFAQSERIPVDGGSGQKVLRCNDGATGQLLCSAISSLDKSIYKCSADECFGQITAMVERTANLQDWGVYLQTYRLAVGADVAARAYSAAQRACSLHYHGYSTGWVATINRTVRSASHALDLVQRKSTDDTTAIFACPDFDNDQSSGNDSGNGNSTSTNSHGN